MPDGRKVKTAEPILLVKSQMSMERRRSTQKTGNGDLFTGGSGQVVLCL